jgi:hypothetical protein
MAPLERCAGLAGETVKRAAVGRAGLALAVIRAGIGRRTGRVGASP